MYNRHPAPGNCHDESVPKPNHAWHLTLWPKQGALQMRWDGTQTSLPCYWHGLALVQHIRSYCWPAQEKSNKSQISCWHGITLLKTWANLLNHAVNTSLKPEMQHCSRALSNATSELGCPYLLLLQDKEKVLPARVLFLLGISIFMSSFCTPALASVGRALFD